MPASYQKQRLKKPTAIENIRITHEVFRLIPDDGEVYHIATRQRENRAYVWEVAIISEDGTRKKLTWGEEVQVIRPS